MVWDLNQINAAFMSGLPRPAESFRAGQDEATARRAAQVAAENAAQDRQIALAQAQRLEKARMDAINNPSPRTYAILSALDPKQSEGYKRAFDVLDADKRQDALRSFSTIHSYLSNGYTDRAKTFLQQRIDADRKAGVDTSEEEGYLAAIDENPKAATGLIKQILWSLVPDEQKPSLFKNVEDDTNADAKLPGEVALTTAQAQKAQTEAQYAPQIITSDLANDQAEREAKRANIANQIGQLEVARGRLDLDRDRLTTDTQLKIDEMTQKYGQLNPASQKIRDDAVISAGVNEGLANRAGDLAKRFQATPMSGGWRASFSEGLKSVFGEQDPVSGLRQSYDALINSQAIKNLPPGPATDKDIELAKKGFPPANASKEHIVSFLRGMEKLQRAAAAVDNRRANWISANGNAGLGPAKQDTVVDGYLVKKGTQFNQFNKAIAGANTQGAPAGVDVLEQRYGGTPADAFSNRGNGPLRNGAAPAPDVFRGAR